MNHCEHAESKGLTTHNCLTVHPGGPSVCPNCGWTPEAGEGALLIEALKTKRPDVVITVTRGLDPHFRWDGDGPDPAEDGFQAYDMTVTATAIRFGDFVTGSDSLGGSYFAPEEPCGEIHGYLPQMVEGALAELDKALGRAKG